MEKYVEFYLAKVEKCLDCGLEHHGTCSDGKYVDEFTCRFCGNLLRDWEEKENEKPNSYCSKPVCFKCASVRI